MRRGGSRRPTCLRPLRRACGHDGKDEPVRASGASTDAAALLLTDFPSPKRASSADDYAALAELISSFGTVRRLGSGALALAYVACGRADAALTTNASVWDIAAGA